MIQDANTLLFKKTLPYFARAAVCNNKFTKVSRTGSFSAINTHKQIIQAIIDLKTDVRLCQGTCEQDINQELIVLIHNLAKKQFARASDAQRAGRNACRNTQAPVGQTKKFETSIHNVLDTCPDKVCR